MLCEPVGVQLSPLGRVSVPETSVASEPETASVIVNESPCVALVGIVTLDMEIEPVAIAKYDINISVDSRDETNFLISSP